MRVGGEEATPSNATFQMLPPDDNILSVGTDEPYQSIQDAINYINEKQRGSDEAKEEDWMIQVRPGKLWTFPGAENGRKFNDPGCWK